MSLVLKDVPAYMTVTGNPAYAAGLNIEGMKRRNYEKDTIRAVRTAYKTVYRQGLTVSEAIAKLDSERQQFPEVDVFLTSIESSEWGIIRGRGTGG